MKIRENDFCIIQVNKYLNCNNEIKFLFVSITFFFNLTICIQKVNFQSNANPVSVSEPGIGLWLIYCVLQFIVFNFLIYLMEARPWSNIDLRKSCRKVENIENDNYDDVILIILLLNLNCKNNLKT